MSWHSVRGHDRIVASLRSNLRSGRLPHAFLFVGPDGVASACSPASSPRHCSASATRRHCSSPVRPVPGASRPRPARIPTSWNLPGRKIDRNCRFASSAACAEFGLKPARGIRRFAIVDDVDDMNDEAANAFLKTLEEPPPGTVLILIATSAELQLETIVSRCQVIRFDPLPSRIWPICSSNAGWPPTRTTPLAWPSWAKGA